MSTALPSGRGLESEIPTVQGSRATRLAGHSTDAGHPKNNSVPSSAEYPATSSYEVDVDVADVDVADVDVLIPSESSLDSATHRIDSAESQVSAATSLASGLAPGIASGNLQQAQTQPALDPSGTLTLEPPAVSGPLDGLVYLAVKRTLDILMSSLLLVLLSPLLLISAICVKLTDGGSILYPHTRVGEGGNEFTCYKFRSMLVDADKMKADLAFFNSHDDHRTFKIPNDPRVTWIGRWMRRTSVDELPQLWNVLQGRMSVVGPRPPVVSEVEQYTWDDMQRLAVKPGLTCIWQVSGRSRLPFPSNSSSTSSTSKPAA